MSEFHAYISVDAMFDIKAADQRRAQKIADGIMEKFKELVAAEIKHNGRMLEIDSEVCGAAYTQEKIPESHLG